MVDVKTDNRARGLDFFIGCEVVVRELQACCKQSKGECALQSLKSSVARDVDFLHSLTLQNLNDRLKHYPFVDPCPFDELLAEMMTNVLEWLRWVSEPDWIAELLHAIGAFQKKHKAQPEDMAVNDAPSGGRASPRDGEAFESRREDLDELEELGKFMYPIPLRLRDLQFMIRPFMEVRSHHYIAGLDAVIAELIKHLLRLYHSIKAWDEMFVSFIKQLAEASLEEEGSIPLILCELCACMEMDVFEAAHRLHHVEHEKYMMRKGDIEVICQKLPIFHDKVLLRGPPSPTYSRSEHLQQMLTGQMRTGSPDGSGSQGKRMRMEALTWWRQQEFGHGIATSIFASSLLAFLVDSGLHPDPYVAQELPQVLERLFSCHMSCCAFMNKLLPKLGGYVDSRGNEIPSGQGLPLQSDLGTCAETVLVFLRQWVGVTRQLKHSEASGKTIKRDNRPGGKGRVSVCSVSGSQSDVRRGSKFDLNRFIQDLTGSKHDVEEVINLLEGATPIPDHIMNVPVDEVRYRIDDDAERLWEHVTSQHLDLTETLDPHHRDLGPYLFIDLLSQENVTPWNASTDIELAKRMSQTALVNPEIAEAAKKGYKMEDGESDEGDEPLSPLCPDAPDHIVPGSDNLSENFGLRLVDWPKDVVGSGQNSSSTFVSYFSETDRIVCRKALQGLPPLPWSFGTDKRNAIILDVPAPGVAPFHCLFTKARAQAMTPCIVPLGGRWVPTYIICPKYQPIQVLNGYRLVCHQWNFEIRIIPTGLHSSMLQILTDEGDVFDVPLEGCHIGAGNRSRQVPNQPSFPPTKFALKHRLKDMSAVHLALNYHAPSNRWTLIDHSPEPFGTLILLKTGTAYPLSHGLRVKLGPVILETVITK